MTRTVAARVAGFAFLAYTAVGSTLHLLLTRATNAEGTAATLALVRLHATDVRVTVVLTLLESFCALVLAVTLYGITREQDNDLALLGLACRLCEGVIGALELPARLTLLWLATSAATSGVVNASSVNTLGSFLLSPAPSIPVGSIFFAVGSLLFSYLLLRGRMVPAALAWFGVIASLLLVVALPLELADFLPATFYVWLPMLVYQLVLGVLLLVKGIPEARPVR